MHRNVENTHDVWMFETDQNLCFGQKSLRANWITPSHRFTLIATGIRSSLWYERKMVAVAHAPTASSR